MKPKSAENFLLILVTLAIFLTGCSLLPSVRQTTKSPWETFDDAKFAFDKITPYQTSTKELQELGFNPFESPNIRILSYLDIIQRFMSNPSIKKEDLDEGIQTCIEAKMTCKAYEIQPRFSLSQRHGNVFLDLLNFKRKTHHTGWEFDALVVMVNDTVVYKLWGGTPSIDEVREAKNPLGPLQEPSGLAREAVSGGL